MNSRPILFSAPMVRAILDGTKTQTRRTLKIQPAAWAAVFQPAPVKTSIGIYGKPGDWIQSSADNHHMHGMGRCPYGVPGDQLWVRETFMPMPHLNARAFYRATDPLVGGKWKPSIFMPRDLSRITLEITDVRVQRLQEITPHDALAEGVGHHTMGNPVVDYQNLWDKINGPGAWQANPYVWALTFKRITP